MSERKYSSVVDDLRPPRFFIVSACAVRGDGSEIEVVHGKAG